MRFESKTLSAKALDFNRKSETNTSSHDLKNNVIIFLASIFFFFFLQMATGGGKHPHVKGPLQVTKFFLEPSGCKSSASPETRSLLFT